MRFSAGQLPNALGVMVACHLEQCSQCRYQAQLFDRLGGDILDTAEPLQIDPELLSRVLSQLDAADSSEQAPAPPPAPVNPAVPRPLQRFVPERLDQLKWTGMIRSIQEYRLPISDAQYSAKLYKIAAGKELPEHTHKGHEFTLVMEGSFSDKAGDYHAGDFILTDTQTIHRPRAARDCDCICFAVLDAPLKLTGMVGRLLNPFLAR